MDSQDTNEDFINLGNYSDSQKKSKKPKSKNTKKSSYKEKGLMNMLDLGNEEPINAPYTVKVFIMCIYCSRTVVVDILKNKQCRLFDEFEPSYERNFMAATVCRTCESIHGTTISIIPLALLKQSCIYTNIGKYLDADVAILTKNKTVGFIEIAYILACMKECDKLSSVNTSETILTENAILPYIQGGFF